MKNGVIAAAVLVSALSGFAQAEDYRHGQSITTYQGIGNTVFGSDGSTV
jgi:hypothetical protein